MRDALQNADLRNLFVFAKKYSSRSLALELGIVAEKFASRYAELDAAGRDDARREYPGKAGRKYAHGWLGQWERLVDSDPDVSGDTALSARTMVRYLKFLPIAQELVARDRVDAVPLKLGGSCLALQRCLAMIDPMHGTPPSKAVRDSIVSVVADAFIHVLEANSGSPTRASAEHSQALDSAIRIKCRERAIDIGEVGASTTRRPAKRSRTRAGTAQSQSNIDSVVSSVSKTEDIAREVTKRLLEMVPDIARTVERDLKSSDHTPPCSPVAERATAQAHIAQRISAPAASAVTSRNPFPRPDESEGGGGESAEGSSDEGSSEGAGGLSGGAKNGSSDGADPEADGGRGATEGGGDGGAGGGVDCGGMTVD